jgi:hypothetical protein
MAAENIDDITMRYEDDGVEVVKELEKAVLTRGSWTTIMFKFQDLDKASGDFKPAKVSIRRYQKTGGEYRQRSKFNISSAKQAYQIIDILKQWFPAEEAEKDKKK